MRTLRKFISNCLLEVYEMTAQEESESQNWAGLTAAQRALGLQDSETIRKDRRFLQDYQRKLRNSTAGKQLINQFINGTNVSIFHKISYQSFVMGRGYKEPIDWDIDNIFSDWINRFGTSGKDMLSCVASDRPLVKGQGYMTNGSNDSVLEGPGVILKGYPVFVSETDIMSQTLGSLPQGLINHQRNSGIAKRPGHDVGSGITQPDFGWAGEVLLDNWQVIGLYYDLSRFGSMDKIYKWSNDAIKLGLPLHLLNNGDYFDSVKSDEDKNRIMGRLFGVAL